MSQLDEMLRSHPAHASYAAAAPAGAVEALARAAEACFACGQTCTSCADACLSEPKIEMLTRCIRLNLDCAEVCHATGVLLLRLGRHGPQPLQAQLAACTQACLTCAEECRKHAGMHAHCRICAEQCQACHDACENMMKAMRHAGEH